ncbi:hypothetical protein SETIT_1G056400v2 [Setaria italica]|uniref:F-box domain-containing protein n=1 Tax=Setaria italica TaxID=4555 RepID=A0A368PI05_SETIT|nr:hypothetical protein SETIT_1G056400v2 [Setaria italica]
MDAASEHGADQGETEDQEDLVRQLPDDALADVLRRLPRRGLAASRCVRKAWRDVIDGRRLLLPHLLPHKVGGIFINFNVLESWEFLARPTTTAAGPATSGDFDYLPDLNEGSFLRDHCNGLLLLYDVVANPATRSEEYFYEDEYLVYDPNVSPHFEVFSIPRIWHKEKPGNFGYDSAKDKLDPSLEELEWPPSQYVLNTYRVIKPPAVDIKVPMTGGLHLGRSEKGVYCALANYYSLLSYQLRHVNKEYNGQTKGPWIFQDINYYDRAGGYNVDAAEQAKFEWDSDNDNVLQINSKICCGYTYLLGFHPYKEVIFLYESMKRGFAYHLNDSKVQDLGNMYPRNHGRVAGNHALVRESFPYTPCWIEDFPINNIIDAEDHFKV